MRPPTRRPPHFGFCHECTGKIRLACIALSRSDTVSIVATAERTSMMSRLSALSLFVVLCHLSLGANAEGADFTGAWTTDASVCNKVFAKSGGRISFTKDSELVGGGLIFHGNDIHGTGAACRIKTTKDDGEVTTM